MTPRYTTPQFGIWVRFAPVLPLMGAERKALCWCLLTMLLVFLQPVRAATFLPTEDVRNPVPLMAYYYIWYNENSWDRAKTDYPVLGRYTSDDRKVMEQHVRWAKAAGIDGFIVSWKSTPILNRRLGQLLEVAAANDFAIWIIYQGLDFYRRPLPVKRVARDLGDFIDHYAGQPALQLYDRPVVIWSGTWKFSPKDVAGVAKTYRDRLYLLASERNLRGYLRLAGLVDGNAYYWSSVNPDTYPGYQAKLDELGRAVHKHGGFWVAPAAPGFDARLIGGTTVVKRKGGETLRRQLNAAVHSAPDAIGLISWNEFSENSQLEPSETYGTQALELLSNRKNGGIEAAGVDSSDPGTTNPRNFYGLSVFGGLAVFIVGSVVLAVTRQLGKPLGSKV